MTQKKTNSTAIILGVIGVAVMGCVATGVIVGYNIQKQFDEVQKEMQLIEGAEAAHQRELDRMMGKDTISDDLQSDIDLVIAMEDAMAKKKSLIATRDFSPEAFKALEDEQVLEILVYDLLPTDDVDWEAEIEKPIEARDVPHTLTAPKGHYNAGDFQKKPPTRVAVVLFDDIRFNSKLALEHVAEKLPPACSLESDIKADPIKKWAQCTMEDINKLARARLGKPLYTGIARMNPETVEMIADKLLAMPPDTPLFGGERTLATVYQQLDEAVPDYLAARRAIDAYGYTKALEEYRKELESRGVLYKEGGFDMTSYYERFNRNLDIPQSPYITGFWLRRMDDGTDHIILNAMQKANARLGNKP